MSGSLYMLRFLFESRRLFEGGLARRIPLRDADLGYVVHAEFEALFGDRAPKPFFVEPSRGPHVSVLGYARASMAELRDHAQAFADPSSFVGCLWGESASKPMPEEFPEGARLGFEARVCPVVRLGKAGPRHDKVGAEVDAFLSACWRAGDGVPVDRYGVYREWLGKHLDASGGATVIEAEVTRFQRERVVRRTQRGAGAEARKSRLVERPDATVRGTLRVTNVAAFQALLERGVGRHRAFGFGMIRLRPALPC